MRQYIFKDSEGKECDKYYPWVFHNANDKINMFRVRGITVEQEKTELFDLYKKALNPHSYEVYENSVLVESGLIENLTTAP